MMKTTMNKSEQFKEKLGKNYFDWLYKSILGHNSQPSYRCLAEALHNIEFRWTVNHDENRAEDGVQFRTDYAVEMGSFMLWDQSPCSVFEMIAGLACRMEDILENPKQPSTTNLWFVLLISNLGLKDCTDENFGTECKTRITRNVDLMLDRKYGRLGHGGLFPIEDIRAKDQRQEELWYQMMKYINESFDI